MDGSNSASRTRRSTNELAARYDEIYANWPQSVARQGQVLDHLLTDLGVDATDHVLDCAGGIGTQLIGLALQGRKVIGTDPLVGSTAASRFISFQVWHWHGDGERYDVERFFLAEATGSADWTVTRHTATYWALTRDQFHHALTQAGFVSVTWRDPDELGFFQPLAIATSP